MPDINTTIILSRAELIFLMNSISAKHLAGIELKEFNLPRANLQKLIRTGKQSLISRSLVDKQTLESASKLKSMVKTISSRDRAIILVRGIRSKGQQLFIYNFYKNSLVQHTMPEEGLHCLKKVNTAADMLNYINQLILLKPVALKDKRVTFSMPREKFLEIQKIASINNINEACKQLMSFGISEGRALLLTKSFLRPMFTMSLGCLKIKKDEVADMISFSVFAIEGDAWGIWPGEIRSEIKLLPVDGGDILAMLEDWLNTNNKQSEKQIPNSREKKISD